MALKVNPITLARRRENGQCVGCGDSDHTRVANRGTPKYGPKGLYCESCFEEANTPDVPPLEE